MSGLSHLKCDRRPPSCSPAVYSDWSVLSKLLLGFVHLSNEIDEAFPGFWHSLLGPVSELELADCSGLAVLRGGGSRGGVLAHLRDTEMRRQN